MNFKLLSIMTAVLIVMYAFISIKLPIAAEEVKYDGDVYYVDSINGNDNNSGLSQDKAFMSVEKVNSLSLKPGDAVLFKKGCIWTDTILNPKGSGNAQHPITISSYGQGDKPIIKSMYDDDTDILPEVDAAVLLKNASYVTIDGLKVINGTPGTGTQYGIRLLLNGNYVSSGVKIVNNTIQGSNLKNWSTMSKSGLNGITAASDSYNGFIDGLLIENNEIYNCKANGITVNGSYSGCDSEGKVNSKAAKGVVVRNNFLNNIGADGILVNNCNEPLVEYNTCSKAHSYASGAHVAIWPFATYKAVLQYNEAYNTQTANDGQGFDCDYQCYYTTFQYNYSHDNQGGFMLICTEPTDWNGNAAYNVGSVVRYNISQNDLHYTFSLVGAIDDTKIYNNTLYTSWNQAGNSTNTFFTFSKGSSKYNGRKYADNTLIANNIFYVESCERFSLSDTTNTVFKNNLVYGRYSYNAPKTGENNIIGQDPCFVNEGKAGVGIASCSAYELYDNSPAIGKGCVIDNNGGLDFFGNAVSVNQAPNIGAYNGDGVKFDENSKIEDEKYYRLYDFEDIGLSKKNTAIARVKEVKNSTASIDGTVVNDLTDSKKSVKLTATSSSAKSQIDFAVYSDKMAKSTGIRFWASGNGEAKKGEIIFSQPGKTYSKSFDIEKDGGYVTFSWHEKYIGSNERRVTDEIMRKTDTISFVINDAQGASTYIDDITLNVGEYDPEKVDPPFEYPERETILVDDFESLSDMESTGGNKYGGPSFGPNRRNGSYIYNGSRVIYAESSSAVSTSVGSYYSFGETFAKLREKLKIAGVEGIRFDLISYSNNADGTPISEDDEYVVKDKKGIYKFTLNSSYEATVKSSNGSDVKIKGFYVEQNKADKNNIARISFDELKYYNSATKETFYLKDIAADERDNWLNGINNLAVAYTTYAGYLGKTVVAGWMIDNLCVYGTFGDVEKTTTTPTTTTTTTTTATTTTTTTTTVATTTSTTTAVATTTKTATTKVVTSQSTTPSRTEPVRTKESTTTSTPPALYGDVNSDGKINMKDVLVLRKYIAGVDVEINSENADCAYDGKINMKDVLILRKHIAGISVKLGK